MNCATLKVGIACNFMSPKGCQFTGGGCHGIIEQCQGCDRAKEFPAGVFCISCPDPAQKWKLGNCNLATHVKKAVVQNTQKVNPLKASKRSTR